MGDEIIKVLDNLGEKLGIAIDWSSENVTPYLYELFERFIAWEMWTSVFYLVIGVLFLAAGLFLIKCMLEIFDNGNEDGLLLVILIFICFILGGFMVFEQIYDIITCLTFPEIMLVEYIGQYVNAQ
jgi:hypothetical protein